MAFEPLATDRDAELLVGLGVDEVFVREKRTLLVTWEDPALPDESWELTLAGGWDQVWATRSLAPWDCPSGLLLEANDGADLSYPGGRGEGEYWTTVSEAAPDVRFWQYYAVLPYHTSPDSLRSAVEEQRDPEWIDFRLVLRAEQYREFGSIVVSLDAEDDLGSSRQTLAQGTFTIEDQR